MQLIFLQSQKLKLTSFPISQFTMTDYSIPFRLDQVMEWNTFVCQIRYSFKIIKTDCDADFEGIFV